MLEELRKKVCSANLELARSGLVRLTWGSVSGIDRELDLIVITPDGKGYDRLTPQDHVIIDMRGHVVQGNMRPSVDAVTHIELYKHFPEIGGITHAHSVSATMFAQAGREIPIYGTMHTDYFANAIPITVRPVSLADGSHALSAAAAIVSRVRREEIMRTPGILVQGDGPFAWGRDAMASVQRAKAMEAIAETAFGTAMLKSHAATSR